MKRTIIGAVIALALALVSTAVAAATCNPGFTFDQVPNTAQWNAAFGCAFPNIGGLLGGPLGLPASTISASPLNILPGIAPTAPNNGDIWTTSGGLFTEVGGATVGPLGSSLNGGTGVVTALGNAVNTAGGMATYPVAQSSLSGLGTGVAAALATAPTGTGGIVLATSPSLTTPALGTPSAIVLTHGTGLPIGTGLSGLGTGVGTALGNAPGTTGGIATIGSPFVNGQCLTANSGNIITTGTACGGGSGADCTLATTVGFVGDGSTANDTALSTYLSGLGGASGCLSFPDGNFNFINVVAYTMANAAQSLTIRGAGTLGTRLVWTGATGGLQLTAQNIQNTFHVRDLTFVTAQASGGNGLAVIGVGANNGQQFQSDILNVDFQGADINIGNTDYWSIAIWIHNWGSINGFNVNTWGPPEAPLAAGGGDGLYIEGDLDTASYTTIINFSQSSFNYHVNGVVLGSYWQGVTFNQCNFNGLIGQFAVTVLAGSSGILALLDVTNSQLSYGGAAPVQIATAINTPTFIGNTITIPVDNGVGINVQNTSTGLIVKGNVFNLFGSPTPTFGVGYAGIGGVIEGNWFHGMAVGVDLQAGSNGVTVLGNSYTGITSTAVINSGSGNTVGCPSGSCP